MMVFAAMALASQADTVVKWGEPGGDAGITTEKTRSGKNLPGPTYDVSNPLNPADGVGGYDLNAAGQTRTFYGATSVAQRLNVVNEDRNGDHLQLVSRADSTAGTYSSMTAWKASDFLAGVRELESMSVEVASRGG